MASAIFSKNIWLYQIGIIVFGIILFFPFLGAIPLFDWDEINFAECAREMIVSGNYLQVQIDFTPFYEKPPGFIWLQVFMFKLFGVNEFAARLPNALAGIVTLLLLFKIGTKRFNSRLGLLWVFCYTASLLPHLYFRSGIIDPVFNLLIISGIYSGWSFLSSNKIVPLFYTTVLIGLAILTKGPVALFISYGVLGTYLLFKQEITLHKILVLFFSGLATLIIPAVWFALDWINNGPGFITEFITYQIRLLTTEDAGHGGFLGFHFIVVFIGCFPSSFFALRILLTRNFHLGQKHFIVLNKILLFFVLALFSIVQSKIIHYSSMAYFPVTLLGALGLYEIYQNYASIGKGYKIAFIIVNFLISIVLILVPLITLFPTLLEELTKKDAFAQAIITLPSPWKFWDVIPGFIMLISGSMIIKWKEWSEKKVFTLLSVYTIAISLSIYFFPARIAYYTQGDLITFIKEVGIKNETIYPLGHKSYAHLFYTGKSPEDFIASPEKPILSQNVPQELYLFSRIDRPGNGKDTSGLTEIKREAGYIYYKWENKK